MTSAPITIAFPFEFDYSDNGQKKTEFAVTVKAPAFQDFKVHAAMTARVREAGINWSVKLSGAARPKRDDAEAAEVKEKTDEEAADEMIEMMAGGLGHESYPEFLEWTRKILTNNARLAVIGETSLPLRDAQWEAIAEKGGMEAVMRVIGTFLRFFDPQPKSAKTTGDAVPSGQPQLRAVH